jgi:hypothetical protein
MARAPSATLWLEGCIEIVGAEGDEAADEAALCPPWHAASAAEISRAWSITTQRRRTAYLRSIIIAEW